MINVLPYLLSGLISHISEAVMQGEGQKIARLRDFRLVGCCAPRYPFALGISWEKLSELVCLCSRPLLCGRLPSLHVLWVELQLHSYPLPGKALSCRQENSPHFCCPCLPPHSLFPLSSPQLQISRQLQFGSPQKIPVQSLLLKFIWISHR